MTAETHDIVVVGGGLVGCAVGRALALAGRQVTILEAEDAVAQHQSGRNSGVIHSGLYYQPGSFRAGFTVSGRGGELQLVGFHHRLTDGIVRRSVVGADMIRRFQRVNQDEVRGTGLELLLVGNLGAATASGDLTVQSVKGFDESGDEVELEYEPSIAGKLGLNVPLPEGFSISSELRFVGEQRCENPAGRAACAQHEKVPPTQRDAEVINEVAHQTDTVGVVGDADVVEYQRVCRPCPRGPFAQLISVIAGVLFERDGNVAAARPFCTKLIDAARERPDLGELLAVVDGDAQLVAERGMDLRRFAVSDRIADDRQ